MNPAHGFRRATGTVRFRITAVAVVAVTVVLSVTGAGLVLAQYRLLSGNIDEAVQDRAEVVSAALAAGRPLEPVAGRGDDELVVQVIGQSGQHLYDSLDGAPDLTSAPSLAAAPDPDRGTAIHTVPNLPVDEGSYRLLSQWVSTPDGPVTLHVAGSLDDVDESTGVLVTALAVAVPSAALVLAALVWVLVGRTLRPVESIRAEVAAIGGADLHRRVPEPPGEDEVAHLARTMNAMLDRVADAAEQQRRFVADASHELRSPLTRIRSELEVDAAHPQTADLAATHRSVLAETVGLQRLVADLLLLAAADDGRTERPTGHSADLVDLDDLLLAEARRLRSEGVEVDTTGVSAAQVRGDRDQLARVVRNLTENAARYAERTVALGAAERDHTAVLSVADDGPGIPAEAAERVFERFARLDDARATSTGGIGLGLAIVRDLVIRHGGAVAVDPAHRPGTRIVVTLPTAGEGDGDAADHGRVTTK